MATLAWLGLGALVLFTVVLVLWAAKLEHKATDWAWLHPPNEDDDGVFLLKEGDDDG